jgi:hypothetical protein
MKCLLWFREKKNKDSKLYLRLIGNEARMWAAMECIAELTQGEEEGKEV